jgi:hypothetical protein
MRRVILCLSLALLATLLIATPASAGRAWCARDPIVNLDGHIVQVWVAIPDEYVHLVNGPIDVEFSTPAGVERSVVFTDEGFNGHGERVTFVDNPAVAIEAPNSFPVSIHVSVSIDETLANAELSTRSIPMEITVIVDGESTVIHGVSSGSWIVIPVNNHVNHPALVGFSEGK